jgi:hypothetical protein
MLRFPSAVLVAGMHTVHQFAIVDYFAIPSSNKQTTPICRRERFHSISFSSVDGDKDRLECFH